MSGFSAEWLALREPVDHRSRSRRVTEAVVKALPGEEPVRVIDLAAGTGSNTRFLAPLLPPEQKWLLVDRDSQLLDRAGQLLGEGVSTRLVDLSRTEALRTLFNAPEPAGHERGGSRHATLVTASALLDLVSEAWLHALCGLCRDQQSAVLFALTYDGRIGCSPAEPEDELIRTLVNQHQHTSKGFGPALGPDATARAAEYLEGLGYQVVTERSDWSVDADSDALQRELIDGWARAAAEILPARSPIIVDWRRRRLDHVRERRSRLLVGHEDLGAFIV